MIIQELFVVSHFMYFQEFQRAKKAYHEEGGRQGRRGRVRGQGGVTPSASTANNYVLGMLAANTHQVQGQQALEKQLPEIWKPGKRTFSRANLVVRVGTFGTLEFCFLFCRKTSL